MARTANAVLFAALCCSCGSDADGGDGDGDFVPMPPPGCELSDPGPVTYPPGPFGTNVGDTIADITLSDCEGNSLSLGEVIAQSPLTLFNVGAAWCPPCIEETETLDAEIFAPFCGRGLRVVQVLFQDEESQAATSLDCREWRGRFELNFPVLYDPLFDSNQYFDAVEAETPLNFLIDASGEIVFKETGTPAADLPARIDALLPP